MDRFKIDVLENMLRRMVEGHLGCSGFVMTETDTLRLAIKELKEVKPNSSQQNDKPNPKHY